MACSTLIIAPAENRHDIEAARLLFREYAASLDFDLRFQGFEGELSLLPGEYSPPAGCLLLAWHNEEPAGCVALRQVWGKTCEMKRLFIRPHLRGLGYGRQLAEEAMLRARKIGYRWMVLDTISSMQTAIGLYGSLGFSEIPPYRYNPIRGARFFALDLESKKI
jgi:carbonic anhydrase